MTLSVVEELVSFRRAVVAEQVEDHPRLSDDTQRYILEVEVELALPLAQQGDVSVESARTIFDKYGFAYYLTDEIVALVKSRRLSREVQAFVLTQEDEDAVSVFASSGHPDDKSVKALVDHESDDVRDSLLQNEGVNLPGEVVGRLAELVGEVPSAAKHPNLPVEYMEPFATHGLELVRANLAQNPNLPPRLATSMTFDPSHSVRFRIAKNHRDNIVILDSSSHFWVEFGPADVLADVALASEVSLEEINALVGNWNGSVRSLVEAISLTMRPGRVS